MDMMKMFKNMVAEQATTGDVKEAIKLINEALNTNEPEKYWVKLTAEHLPLTCSLLKQGILKVAVDPFNQANIIYCPVKPYTDRLHNEMRAEAMKELKTATRKYLPDEYTPVDEQIALIAESIGDSYDASKIPTVIKLIKEDVLRCNSIGMHEGKNITEADTDLIEQATKEYASCRVANDEEEADKSIEELVNILETGKIKGEDD